MKKKLKDQYVKQKGLCIWCGKMAYPSGLPFYFMSLETGAKSRKEANKHIATIEHIKPKSRGGANSIYNLAMSHKGCNVKRGNYLINPNFKVLDLLEERKRKYFIKATAGIL